MFCPTDDDTASSARGVLANIQLNGGTYRLAPGWLTCNGRSAITAARQSWQPAETPHADCGNRRAPLRTKLDPPLNVTPYPSLRHRDGDHVALRCRIPVDRPVSNLLSNGMWLFVGTAVAAATEERVEGGTGGTGGCFLVDGFGGGTVVVVGGFHQRDAGDQLPFLFGRQRQKRFGAVTDFRLIERAAARAGRN